MRSFFSQAVQHMMRCITATYDWRRITSWYCWLVAGMDTILLLKSQRVGEHIILDADIPRKTKNAKIPVHLLVPTMTRRASLEMYKLFESISRQVNAPELGRSGFWKRCQMRRGCHLAKTGSTGSRFAGWPWPDAKCIALIGQFM